MEVASPPSNILHCKGAIITIVRKACAKLFSHAHKYIDHARNAPVTQKLNEYMVRFKLKTAVFLDGCGGRILLKKVSSNHCYSLAHLGGGRGTSAPPAPMVGTALTDETKQMSAVVLLVPYN